MRPVTVIIVAFHSPETLDRSLAGLERSFAATVVDNSSSAAVRRVAFRHGADYVDPGRNLGFAAAVNLGLAPLLAGPPTDPLLLNPDAVIDRFAIEKLSSAMHGDSTGRFAAVTPRLIGDDGREQRVMWPFPSPIGAWSEAMGFRRGRRSGSFAIGAALLLNWDALTQVGLFDERFFLYAEEADWQRRAAALGWRSDVCMDAIGRHLGAAADIAPARRLALFHAAQETYVRKWHGRAGWWTYRAAAVAGAAVRALLLSGDRRADAARRALLYARGPSRCA